MTASTWYFCKYTDYSTDVKGGELTHYKSNRKINNASCKTKERRMKTKPAEHIPGVKYTQKTPVVSARELFIQNNDLDPAVLLTVAQRIIGDTGLGVTVALIR